MVSLPVKVIEQAVGQGRDQHLLLRRDRSAPALPQRSSSSSPAQARPLQRSGSTGPGPTLSRRRRRPSHSGPANVVDKSPGIPMICMCTSIYKGVSFTLLRWSCRWCAEGLGTDDTPTRHHERWNQPPPDEGGLLKTASRQPETKGTDAAAALQRLGPCYSLRRQRSAVAPLWSRC